jgi:hypothetical protein
MIGSTKEWVWSRALINTLLLAFGARPGAALMTTPTVRLASAVSAVSPDSAPTDFTECTFTGYAGVALTLTNPAVNVGPSIQGLLANAVFVMSALTAGAEAAVAVYLTSGDGATFYGGEMLNPNVNFANPGDFFDYTLILPASVDLLTA